MKQAMSTLNTFSEKERQYHQYQARQEYLREQRTISAWTWRDIAGATAAKLREEAAQKREEAAQKREELALQEKEARVKLRLSV